MYILIQLYLHGCISVVPILPHTLIIDIYSYILYIYTYSYILSIYMHNKLKIDIIYLYLRIYYLKLVIDSQNIF